MTTRVNVLPLEVNLKSKKVVYGTNLKFGITYRGKLISIFREMLSDTINKEDDILDAVKEVLGRRGVLSSMKARIRAEVFHALDDRSVQMPQKPNDVYLANELIRDFMICMKLDSSLSVLTEEIGQPGEMNVDREFIGGELGFNTMGCDKDTPLLMMLIQHFVKHRRQKELEDMTSMSVST